MFSICKNPPKLFFCTDIKFYLSMILQLSLVIVFSQKKSFVTAGESREKKYLFISIAGGNWHPTTTKKHRRFYIDSLIIGCNVVRACMCGIIGWNAVWRHDHFVCGCVSDSQSEQIERVVWAFNLQNSYLKFEQRKKCWNGSSLARRPMLSLFCLCHFPCTSACFTASYFRWSVSNAIFRYFTKQLGLAASSRSLAHTLTLAWMCSSVAALKSCAFNEIGERECIV